MWSTIVTVVVAGWNCLPQFAIALKFSAALINFITAVTLLVQRLRRWSRRHASATDRRLIHPAVYCQSGNRRRSVVLVLAPLDLIVLVTLSSWPDGTHGYQLLQAVRADHDANVATTSLYRGIRGLLDRGLIAEVALAAGEDPRRRRYQVTAAGLQAAKAEQQRLLRLFATSPRLAGAASPRLARTTSPRLAGVPS